MIKFLSLPFCIGTVVLYLMLWFFGSFYPVWIISTVIIFGLSYFFLKNEREEIFREVKEAFSYRYIPIFGIIFLFIFLKGFTLSPFVFLKNIGSFNHIQITDVGDYYKHALVITTLTLDGLPPHNPYFPDAKLSYYFGYYLIPSLITKIFFLQPNVVIYFYSLLTDLIIFTTLLFVYKKFLKKTTNVFFGMALVITGLGFDVLPLILSKLYPLIQIISPSLFDDEKGLALINTYRSSLFVPQHFFAAFLLVVLTYFILKEKQNFFVIVFFIVSIFLSSLVVCYTMLFWLMLIFIFVPQKRVQLLMVGLLSLLLLIPYFIFLSDRGNIVYFYKFSPFEFIGTLPFYLNFAINSLLTFLFKYGPLLFTLPILFLLRYSNIKKNLIYFLGLSVPFIATWFFRSNLFNDFSLRTSIPIQLIFPLFFIHYMENEKLRFLRNFLTGLVVFTILVSSYGLLFEYYWHYKKREIAPPKVSELIFKIRKEIPENVTLASVERERWVEFIPPLTQRKVLSPFLYDTYVYVGGNYSAQHASYEGMALNLFIDYQKSRSLEDIVKDKNMQFSELKDFFSKYKADKFIISNQIWLKKDVNPWFYIFEQMGVKTEPLTPQFTMMDYKELISETKQNIVSMDLKKAQKIDIKERKIPLKKGLWFLTYCNPNASEHVHLELEDYYLLFDQELNNNDIKCVGKLFYLGQDENVQMSENSKIKNIYAIPVEIKREVI